MVDFQNYGISLLIATFVFAYGAKVGNDIGADILRGVCVFYFALCSLGAFACFY